MVQDSGGTPDSCPGSFCAPELSQYEVELLHSVLPLLGEVDRNLYATGRIDKDTLSGRIAVLQNLGAKFAAALPEEIT